MRGRACSPCRAARPLGAARPWTWPPGPRPARPDDPTTAPARRSTPGAEAEEWEGGGEVRGALNGGGCGGSVRREGREGRTPHPKRWKVRRKKVANIVELKRWVYLVGLHHLVGVLDAPEHVPALVLPLHQRGPLLRHRAAQLRQLPRGKGTQRGAGGHRMMTASVTPVYVYRDVGGAQRAASTRWTRRSSRSWGGHEPINSKLSSGIIKQ